MSILFRVLLVIVSVTITACQAPTPRTQPGSAVKVERPLVIAHRGASGERPEHTLAAYRLAIAQGADFIEPDLVPTRDGVLIARHENELSSSTDVAAHPEFADRRTRKRIDGVEIEGWFSEDFSLAEIKTLRARERAPELRPANTAYDGQESIPTLAEIIALVRAADADGRRVGVYPETKHPTYFANEGHHLDGTPIRRVLGAMLVETLVAEGFTDPRRLYIQSFELAPLLQLRRDILPAHGLNLPLVLLVGELRELGPHGAFSQPYDLLYRDGAGAEHMTIYAGLAQRVPGRLGAETGYAQLTCSGALAWLAEQGIAGIGPWKDSVLERVAIEPAPAAADAPRQRLTGRVHPMIAQARAAGLQVHAYTLRAESALQAQDRDGQVLTMADEIERLLAAGATGFFTDQPAAGVAARDAYLGDPR